MKYYIKKPVLNLVNVSWLAILVMTSSNVNAADHRITICHYPPGNVENVQIITIDDHAWSAHYALHGDGDLEDTLYDTETQTCSNASYSNAITTPSGAGLVFSIDEPLIQESTAVSDILNTYNFETVSDWDKVFRNDYPDYTTAVWEGVGTYEGTGGLVDTPNQYGAAGGVGKYLFIRSTVHSTEDNPGVTLTFDTPVAYFGFWWSAGDYQNKLEITLTDGSVINVETELVWNSEGFVNEIASNNGHMGNPTAAFLDQNSGEPYAYLNLTSKDENSKIVSIRFHGRNFETDNHTVTTELIDPPGTIIPLAPNFGQAGRFNVQEVNKVKSTAAAEAAAAEVGGDVEP